MRKQLGYITTLLFLCASALMWTGCANKCCDEQPVCCEQPCEPVCKPVCPAPCKPVCPPACKPVCKPVCPPPCKPVCKPVCPEPCKPACPPACPPPACKPVCKPVCEPVCPPEPCCKILPKCKHPSSNQLCCIDGITVSARNPTMCMLGNEYPLEFEVKACKDVCDVVVNTHLPDGVTFIRSNPEARVEGKKLTWNFGSMGEGEVRPAKVWLKCECEGELCACFCATATPVRFCSLLCAKPILVCHKCAPEEADLCEPINYTITVTNKGSCAAEEVVVTDNVPDGMEHASCQKTLVFKLGTLEPCQTKKINFTLTSHKRGNICNTAVVTACNADSTSCQACVCVACCSMECSKVGPKEQQIGKNADYQITVVNTGDKLLTDIVVADQAPSSTSIVAASGAQVKGNQAIWRLRELKPGEKATFNITLTSCTPGCFTNRVSVTNCQGCNSCCEATTRWKGKPALNACISVSENPICIGETTTYNIQVVNQGSESDANVVVRVKFPQEIVPVTASSEAGAGKISGQEVTFAPVQSFAPRQTVNYRIEGRAKQSGEGRVILEVSSDMLKTPLSQQESTIVN